MRFGLLLPHEIEAGWEQYGAMLAPAIARDEQRQAIDVYRDLMAGDMVMFEAELSGSRGIAVAELAPSATAARCFWLIYVAGQIDGGPRKWLEQVRTVTSYFEGIARAYDCTELRIEGRDWHFALASAGYERMAERPDRNELRKAL